EMGFADGPGDGVARQSLRLPHETNAVPGATHFHFGESHRMELPLHPMRHLSVACFGVSPMARAVRGFSRGAPTKLAACSGKKGCRRRPRSNLRGSSTCDPPARVEG